MENGKSDLLILDIIFKLTYFCDSEEKVQEIINDDLYDLYAKLINDSMSSIEIEFKCLTSIFCSLSLPTLYINSERIVNQNLKYDLFGKALAILNGYDFLSRDNANNPDMMNLYTSILLFLLVNLPNQNVRKVLKGLKRQTTIDGT